MKILFYVEPLPIRNSRTHFGDIAKNVAKLISGQSNNDVRLFANTETLNLIPEDQRKLLAHRIVSVPEFEISDYIDPTVTWDQGGIDSWLSVISGTGPSVAFSGLLAQIWHRFNFDVIVTWGENGVVSSFAKRWGAVHISMELGCTRAPYFDSIVMDPFGTNGSSLPSILDIEGLKQITDGSQLSGYHSIQAYSSAIDSIAYEQYLGPVDSRVRSLSPDKQKKIAFLPLQLYDDANLLVHSPYDSLTDVLKASVPRLIALGYFIIIKPHPDSRHRPNASFENAIAKSSIDQYREDFIWLDDLSPSISNTSIFAVCDIVVTVNSSVGFEALYHDKTCIILGDASYKVKGIFPTLETIDESFDRDAYLVSIGELRSFMLEAYLQPRSTFLVLDSFCSSIAMIVEAYRASNGDPLVYAKSLYSARTLQNRFQNNSFLLSGISSAGTNDPAPPKEISFKAITNAKSLPLFVPGIATEKDAERILEALKALYGSNRADSIIHALNHAWTDHEEQRLAILKLGLMDKATYAARNPNAKLTSKNTLTHFIESGEIACESPRAGINLGYYRSEEQNYQRPLLRLLINLVETAALHGHLSHQMTDEELHVLDDTRNRVLAFPETGAKIVVVAHLFYYDLVSDLLEKLRFIEYKFDLVVTLPLWGTRRIEEDVRKHYPDALILKMPNRGRDIGPFVELIPFIVRRNYDLCLKVHTKKGYHAAKRRDDVLGDVWRRRLLDGVLGSARSVKTIVTAFNDNSSLMMVGSSDLYVSLADYPSASLTNSFSSKDGVFSEPTDSDCFFAGTMFWVRPSCLEILSVSGFSIESFDTESGSNDGALAHDFERYFGHLAGSAGYISAVEDDASARSLTQPARPNVEKIGPTLKRLRTKGSSAPKPNLLW